MSHSKSPWASKTMWMHILTLLLAVITTVSGDSWVKENPQIVQYLLYAIGAIGMVLRFMTDSPIDPSKTVKLGLAFVMAMALAAPSAYSQEPPAPTPAPTPPAPVVVAQPKIDAPKEVTVPVNHLASVLITSEGCWTKYTMFGAEADAFREYDPDNAKTIHLRVIGYQEGVTYLVSYCGNEVGVTDPVVTKITFGNPPAPPPPGPGPGPNPPVPPAPSKISVLIVDETSDYGTPAYKDYLDVLNSTKLVDYMNKHCSDTNGQPDWRHWDKDVDASKEAKKWQDALKMPRTSLPWIVISNGTAGFSGPLPKSEADALSLLQKWGGN